MYYGRRVKLFTFPPAGDEVYGPIEAGKQYDRLVFEAQQPDDTVWIHCYKGDIIAAMYNVRYIELILFME
jgi:hypothetical protein